MGRKTREQNQHLIAVTGVKEFDTKAILDAGLRLSALIRTKIDPSGMAKTISAISEIR